jgi:hypothetical protein
VLLRELRRLASNCLKEVIKRQRRKLASFCRSDPAWFADRVFLRFVRRRSLLVVDGFPTTGHEQ